MAICTKPTLGSGYRQPRWDRRCTWPAHPTAGGRAAVHRQTSRPILSIESVVSVRASDPGRSARRALRHKHSRRHKWLRGVHHQQTRKAAVRNRLREPRSPFAKSALRSVGGSLDLKRDLHSSATALDVVSHVPGIEMGRAYYCIRVRSMACPSTPKRTA